MGNNGIFRVNVTASGWLSPDLRASGLIFSEYSTGPEDLCVSNAEFDWTNWKHNNTTVSGNPPAYTRYSGLDFGIYLHNQSASERNNTFYYFSWESVIEIWFQPSARGEEYNFTFTADLLGLPEPVESVISLYVTQR